MDWNDKNTQYLIDNWGTKTSTEIAKKFGTTRNSIIGKARRLDLSHKKLGKPVGETPPKRKKRDRSKEKLKLKNIKGMLPIKPSRLATGPARLNFANPKRIRRSPIPRAYPYFPLSGGCRWIGEQSFCDASRVEKTPYCKEHLNLVIKAD